MNTVFKGRAVLAGSVQGRAMVSTVGFNPLAAYCDAIVDGTDTAICADRQNDNLYGKTLNDSILCAPNCVGSTTAGPVWEFVAANGIAPKALLLSGPVDSLTAGGLVLAEVWIGKPVVLIDCLGENFLAAVCNGSRILVDADGTVSTFNALNLMVEEVI